jgi:excisionase family DNA binding protein
MDGDVTKRYVDIKRVSRYTSLPIKTLYDWSNQGKFPCIKIGRRILFDIKDVDEAMSNLKKPLLKLENTVNKIIGDLHGNII